MAGAVPATLPEWEAYVKQLAGESLRSKGINANTQDFADVLLGEGFSMKEVKTIITYFVRQFVATGQLLPSGGAFDLYALAQADPIASAGLLLDDLAVGELAANPPEEGPDDMDDTLEQLELEEPA